MLKKVVRGSRFNLTSAVPISWSLLPLARETHSQGQAAGEQRSQIERVNNESLGYLRSIESTATSLQGTVEKQFEPVLAHRLDTTLPETLKETHLMPVERQSARRSSSASDPHLRRFARILNPPGTHLSR